MKGAPYLGIPVAVGLLAAFAMASGGTEAPASGPLTASMMAGDAPVLGDPGAGITIVEWGDYQCTFCFRFHGTSLQALKAEYIDTGDVKLVFRDFPLNGPDSVLAAEASYCAKEQGRYWEYHDTVYKTGRARGRDGSRAIRLRALQSRRGLTRASLRAAWTTEGTGRWSSMRNRTGGR
ncbi:protein-disulfide isomerase [Cenarchaeum symbiosum A]|uniref:Protein-disulfide isomerase n=1 Tax=Cenarchaeum symbiosum (strain A) TaxID=414004 RepID=A0RX26_CENSY|nr:protein-disulfide isomerase [Cenarchaeum symbiosum A]